MASKDWLSPMGLVKKSVVTCMEDLQVLLDITDPAALIRFAQGTGKAKRIKGSRNVVQKMMAVLQQLNQNLDHAINFLGEEPGIYSGYHSTLMLELLVKRLDDRWRYFYTLNHLLVITNEYVHTCILDVIAIQSANSTPLERLKNYFNQCQKYIQRFNFEHSSSEHGFTPFVDFTSSTGSLLELAAEIDIDLTNRDKVQVCIPYIMKNRDLSLLNRIGGVKEAMVALRYDLKERTERKLQVNADTNCRQGFFFHLFWNACRRNKYSVVLSFICAGLSFGMDTTGQGPRYGWHGGAAILFTLFLQLLFPSVAKFIVRKERQKEEESFYDVYNNGDEEPCKTLAHDLIQGHIVNLETGNLVPADVLFCHGNYLEVDEDLYPKIDGKNPFMFYGSKVTEGSGLMLVTSVGREAIWTKHLSSANQDSDTFLETQIEKCNSFAENLGLLIMALMALVELISFVCKRQEKKDVVFPELKGNTETGVLTTIVDIVLLRPRGRAWNLLGAFAMLVTGILHAIPLAVIISLSFWKQKLESLGMEPRNLFTGATMGLVDEIYFKITAEAVQVKRFYIGGRDVYNNTGLEIEQVVIEAICEAIDASTYVPPEIFRNDELFSDWIKSLLRTCTRMEWSESSPDYDFRRLFADYDSRRLEAYRYNVQFLEGTASKILKSCSHFCDRGGKIHAIEDLGINFELMITEIEESGLTAIAFACKKTCVSIDGRNRIILLAIVVLKNSYLDEIELIMEDIKKAKVNVTLEAEDATRTEAISRKLGIFQQDTDDTVVSDDTLHVVQSLRESGHVVAFFGGSSVSESPALDKADVGITRKTGSSGAARKSSNLIIPNGILLPTIIQFGRCSYHNIQKFTELELTALISGSLINLVAAICSWDLPLTTIQLLWVNLVTCLVGAQMMVMDLKIEEVRVDKPMRTQPVVTRVIWIRILIQAFYQASSLLSLHFVGFTKLHMTENVWKSIVFNSFLLCQIFNLFRAMKLFREEMIQILCYHYWFCLSAVIVLIAQVLCVQFGNSLAASARLNAMDWFTSFVIAALPWSTEWAIGSSSRDEHVVDIKPDNEEQKHFIDRNIKVKELRNQMKFRGTGKVMRSTTSPVFSTNRSGFVNILNYV